MGTSGGCLDKSTRPITGINWRNYFLWRFGNMKPHWSKQNDFINWFLADVDEKGELTRWRAGLLLSMEPTSCCVATRCRWSFQRNNQRWSLKNKAWIQVPEGTFIDRRGAGNVTLLCLFFVVVIKLIQNEICACRFLRTTTQRRQGGIHFGNGWHLFCNRWRLRPLIV